MCLKIRLEINFYLNYSSSPFFYLFFYLYFICTLSLSVPPFFLLLALSSFLSLFFSSSFSLFLSIYLSISPCPLLSLCPTVSLSHKHNNTKLVCLSVCLSLCLSVCLSVYLSFVAFSLFLYPFRFVLQVRVFFLARRWMIILLCWNTPLLWPVR